MAGDEIMSKKERKGYLEGEEIFDIYTEEGIQELVENDEMKIGEAGFMNGYLEEDEETEEEIAV